MGGEADIGSERDGRRAPVGEGVVVSRQRGQRREERRGGRRTEHEARRGPRRQARLGARGRGGSGVGSGGKLVKEREADRTVAGVGEFQSQRDVFLPEQVGSGHRCHLRDGQAKTRGIECERVGPGLPRRVSAARDGARQVPVLRPQGQTTGAGQPGGVQHDHGGHCGAAQLRRRRVLRRPLPGGTRPPLSSAPGQAARSGRSWSGCSKSGRRSESGGTARSAFGSGVAKRDAGLVRAALLSRDRERQARGSPSPATPGAGPG